MARPKKQNHKQSNAANARAFRHEPFSGLTSTPSTTWASTLAATTPPNSGPPSTIDPSDVPALDSWGQQEGLTQEYSSGSEENLNPITIDDYDSGEGYGSDDCVSEMDGKELRDSLELQMQGEIEQIQGSENFTAYGVLMRGINADHWKKAETNRGLGYNGLSRRKMQLDLQRATQAEEENKKLRVS